MKKIHMHDETEVREKILHAITEMCELVSKTLGKDGKSILIERGTAEPLIVDDGRRVAEMVKYDCPIEHMIARVFYGLARKTDEVAGDGTTTSMILAHAIVKYVFEKRLASGGMASSNVSVSEIDAEIQEAKDEVLKLLKEMVKPIESEKDLANVAMLASGDEKIGQAIGKMYKELGKDGHIAMEFNLLSTEIETEVVPGLRFLAGYAESWMMTDNIHKVARFKNVHVLVAYTRDLDDKMLTPIVHKLQKDGKEELVVVAQKFTPTLLKSVHKTAKEGEFKILCVRAPSAHEEQYRDIAIWTGAKYHDKKTDITQATIADLGYVTEIEVTDDTCILVGGRGDEAEIAMRINEVKAEAEQQKMPQFKQARLDRVSALSGGVGVIRIGAPTDEDRTWWKYKIEDAKYATRHAYNHGVVPGGGMAFKKISEKLPEGNILKEPLLAPYKKLKENSPNLIVDKSVVDPVFVEKVALETACSAAAKIIRIGGVIANKPKPELEEAFKNITNTENGQAS